MSDAESPPLSHDDPESPFFRAWVEFVLKRWYVAIALAVGLTALSVWAIYPKPKTDMSIEAFLASESEELVVLEEYRKLFGRDDMFLVIADSKADGGVFTAPFLDKLRGLHTELSGLNLKIDSLGTCMSRRGAKRREAREAAKAREQAAAPTTAQPGPKPPATAPGKTGGTGGAGGDDFGDEGGDDFGDESADFEGFEEAASGTPATSGGGQKLSKADREWGNEGGGTIVDEITSLINARRTRGRTVTTPDGKPATEIVVGEFMDPWPAASELPGKKAEALADPNLVGRVVDAKARYAVVVVRMQCMAEEDMLRVNDAVLAVLDKHGDEGGFKLYLSGPPALTSGLNKVMLGEMRTLMGLSILCLLIVMGFLFRHWMGVLAPLTVVGLSAIWTFGFMALFGYPMTMLSTILPAFVICVGVGDTVHVLSVYRDKKKHGVPNREAIATAVASTAKPILFTTLTTAVGLLSFKFASIDAIQEMGIAGAAGVFMAFFNTLLVLPVMLLFAKKSKMGVKGVGDRDFIDRFLDWCLRLSITRKGRRGTIFGGLGLSAIAVLGALMLYVYHNPLAWMPDHMPTKQAFTVMDDNIGGTATIQLLITPKSELGLKHRETLLALEKLEDHIRAYRYEEEGHPPKQIITNAISVLDFVKETNQALNAGDPAKHVLPPTQATVGEALFLFEQAGPAQLRRMATADLKRSQMTLNVRWMEATSYRGLADHVRAGIDEFIGDNAVVQTTGAVFTLVTTVGTLISNLLRSFGVAFGVITLLMMLLLKDVRLGLIAMVPNLMPIVIIMGVMGVMDIPIDMANLLIASIAMGLAVDDTIHFLHHFKAHYDLHGDVEAALTHSMNHSGRALVSTSLILSVGFFVFLAGELASIQRFGGLIGITVIIALLVDLMFGPALLRLVYKNKRPDRASESGHPSPSPRSMDAPDDAAGGDRGVNDALAESTA